MREIPCHHNNLVVAGLDASWASRNAVDWAAAEAARRRASLRLVHAYSLPVAGYPGYTPIPAGLEEQLRIDGRAMLDEVAATLHGAYPELSVTTQLAKGHAVTALRHESEGCLLTVVGSRGTGRVTGILLGSVALAIVSTNPAPVAVIHPHQRTSANGPVVVGVDGSPTSESAIGFAFETAERWQARLVAVHSWCDTVQGTYPLQPLMADLGAIENEERALLSERLAGWRDKYPDVPVQQEVVRGLPTPTLLEFGRSAQVVVVGSHGRGGFVGMLLGSTSQALVTHGGSPVVVVRPQELS